MYAGSWKFCGATIASVRDKNITLVFSVEWPQRDTTTPSATTLTFWPTWMLASQMMPLRLPLPCTRSSLLNSGAELIKELKNRQSHPSAVMYKITLNISVGAMFAREVQAQLCIHLLVGISWILMEGVSFGLLKAFVELILKLIKGCWISILSISILQRMILSLQG